MAVIRECTDLFIQILCVSFLLAPLPPFAMKKFSIGSIQAQLVLSFTFATLVPAGISTIVGMKLIYDEVITRAQTKTISDLQSALEIYRNKTSQIESTTRLTAERSLIINALRQRDFAFLEKELPKVRAREHLDLLTITDRNGVVVCRGRAGAHRGDTITGNALIRKVLATGQLVSGTAILERTELEREDTVLAARARMEVIATPRARPSGEGLSTAGMMLAAAVPLFDPSGKLLGVLVGGMLLNRDTQIVDKINQTVHAAEVYHGRETGTATIFQGDLRISTNVKNSDGSRAISTLVSDEVADAVIGGGTRWVGHAFVVNAWYITAYEPLRDITGRVIGMLYVGVLRQPYYDVLWSTLARFGAIALGGVFLIVAIAITQARRISRPLKTLEGIAQQVADGDFRQEVSVDAPLEITHLATSITRMAAKLEKEREELEEWGTMLERRVKERSDELSKIHAQLFRSEKLASLGKLAAGVAHEINNPLTGILTNSSLMLEDLAAEDPMREEVEVIVHETIRCRDIVKRLLDFARQTKPQKKLTNLNDLMENIVLLVRNQASFRNIQIERHLEEQLPLVLTDPDQIQQVFINIILNAAEAMTQGGLLTIRSSLDAGTRLINLSFADTGPGIAEEQRERIFDPFFTTKEHGTGLGLSISYGIIEQHGGTISVESAVGKGTTFTIQLPVTTAEQED
jgi:two-component system, NtrC family, sensor kinase